MKIMAVRRQLILCDMQENVGEAYRRLNLGVIFQIVDSLDEARQLMQKKDETGRR